MRAKLIDCIIINKNFFPSFLGFFLCEGKLWRVGHKDFQELLSYEDDFRGMMWAETIQYIEDGKIKYRAA